MAATAKDTGKSDIEEMMEHFNEMTLEIAEKDKIITAQQAQLVSSHKAVQKEAIRHSLLMTTQGN